MIIRYRIFNIGTFSRRQGNIYMDLTFANRAMQPMAGFAIQFNKNSFGLAPVSGLQVNSPLPANQQTETSLQMNTGRPISTLLNFVLHSITPCSLSVPFLTCTLILERSKNLLLQVLLLIFNTKPIYLREPDFIVRRVSQFMT